MLGSIAKVIVGQGLKIGFGKAEAAKTARGVGIAGAGAAVVQVLDSLGRLPAAATDPAVLPYTVAVVAAIINTVRQFIKDNG